MLLMPLNTTGLRSLVTLSQDAQRLVTARNKPGFYFPNLLFPRPYPDTNTSEHSIPPCSKHTENLQEVQPVQENHTNRFLNIVLSFLSHLNDNKTTLECRSSCSRFSPCVAVQQVQ